MALDDELDPWDILSRAESRVAERRAGELEDLLLTAQWAAVHSTDPKDDPGHRQVPGCDRLVQVGGEGTPKVRQLCLAELGIAFDVHTQSARSMMADVLDLQHRLPRVWAAARELHTDFWVVRKVARHSRELPLAVVGLVDAALAPVLATLGPSRLIELLEAKVVEADPETHRARLEKELRQRYVGLSRTDQFGLRTVVAHVEAGDAAWFDAVVDQIADILAARVDLRPETPRDLGRDELRALAFGFLARPAEALQLILESTHNTPAATDTPDSTDTPDTEPDVEADVEGDVEGDVLPPRAVALPADLLETLRTTDLRRLRPGATLFVHLHHDVLTGTPGVARVEGVGPLLVSQVMDLLVHANVTVRPVIDLAEQRAVDGYEHPTSMKRRVRLRSPGEGFPASTTITGLSGQAVDIDHAQPWDPGGPPGQTCDANAEPLTRQHHRAKTHLPYFVWLLDSTTKVWKTPHGLWRIVDHHGTHLPDRIEIAEVYHAA